MSNRVWITWEHQTRNISMAKLLGCQYFEFASNQHRIIRYVVLSYSTLKLLFSQKPTEVFFQNPSVMLALICTFYKMLSRKTKVIGDYHNAALEKSALSPINNFVSRNIDLTIVSNSNLVSIVEQMRGRAFVMPDPIPQPHGSSKNSEEQHNPNIVFICSWASDEPILIVLDAFINSGAFRDKGVNLYVTGKMKVDKLDRELEYYASEGIKFLGFVAEDAYWRLIENSICNIDLTTREDCLVCGAYESIAVGNIVILSNNQASRTYFGDNCIYTDNSSSDLKAKIVNVLSAEQSYKEIARNAKEIFLRADERKKADMNIILNT